MSSQTVNQEHGYIPTMSLSTERSRARDAPEEEGVVTRARATYWEQVSEEKAGRFTMTDLKHVALVEKLVAHPSTEKVLLRKEIIHLHERLRALRALLVQTLQVAALCSVGGEQQDPGPPEHGPVRLLGDLENDEDQEEADESERPAKRPRTAKPPHGVSEAVRLGSLNSEDEKVLSAGLVGWKKTKLECELVPIGAVRLQDNVKKWRLRVEQLHTRASG
ncbi:hypothetical protein Efla_004631 [Eimeria flavescens]